MNVLIELGSYDAKYIRKFVESPIYMAMQWDIHAFEPNPNIEMNCPDQVIAHRKAAWIEDGDINLFVGSKNNKNYSSSLIAHKKTGKLDRKHPVKVECINFGQWILDTFKPSDFIILRMDIEGAEYKVIPSMLKNGSLSYVNEFFVEPHWDRLGIPYKEHRTLMKQVSEVTEVYYLL